MTAKYNDPELDTAARVQDLMGQMTLTEKVGQMVLADGRKGPEALIERGEVGAFLHILGETTVRLQRLAASSRLGIPLLFGIDAIHGHGFWPGATVFPTQLALSCSWDPDRVEEMCRITAREMLATGLGWTFSPVLCIARDLRWGRIGETFGEDPHLIAELGKAAVRGYQGERLSDPDSVAACAKHFAGYSETLGGRDATEADLSRRKLRSTFLPAFEQVVRAGCRTVMTAYQAIDGVACVVNRWLLTEVLREAWGFQGFVVTDWDNVGRAHKEQKLYASIGEAVAPSVSAGNDLIMVTPEFFEAAMAAVESGALSEREIDRSVERILTLKFDLGLFDHKRYPPFERVAEIIGAPEHRRALLPAALESIVLLKNEASPSVAREPNAEALLPLNCAALRRVAVIGPNADDRLAQLGDWSFGSGQAGLATDGHPAETVVTVLDGIRRRATGVAVDYAKGCEVLSDDETGIAEAVAIARLADVVIAVVGDVLAQVGEQKDRAEIDLSGGQLPLLRAVQQTGTPLVVVLINSKPLTIPWVAEHATAILEAFNPGMEGGTAIAQILFGDANPVGKLSISFPRSVGSQPAYYDQPPGWHGSPGRNYDPRPLFAFGFGLSYTTYEYSNLRLSRSVIRRGESLAVTVDVANQGSRSGTEIVQLYLNDCYTSLSTPAKLLKAYRRVRLEPGEKRAVHFELGFDDLAFIGSADKPVVEPGEFEVLVGPSSQDIDLLRASFQFQELPPLG